MSDIVEYVALNPGPATVIALVIAVMIGMAVRVLRRDRNDDA